jgi:hypothetical protein
MSEPTPVPELQLWVALHHHRHGIDVIPRIQINEPTPDDIIAGLGSLFEPDRDEDVDIVGPFAITAEVRVRPSAPQAALLEACTALVEAIDEYEADESGMTLYDRIYWHNNGRLIRDLRQALTAAKSATSPKEKA